MNLHNVPDAQLVAEARSRGLYVLGEAALAARRPIPKTPDEKREISRAWDERYLRSVS